MSAVIETRFSHKLFEPPPTHINDNGYCVMIFDRLRLQREQGRFCDVIVKVHGREFPAHRCVLASCSPWFDKRLKVHKTMKEIIEVETCKNYEVFHLVLTYMYTGNVRIDKHNVAEILNISHCFQISKLKNYCSEYLGKNLKASNCLNVMELSVKFHLADLSKQTSDFIDKHFEHIIQFHEIDKMSLSDIQNYLSQRVWFLSSEFVLQIITRWVTQNPNKREDSFMSLLHNVNWTSLDRRFINDHLDKEEFYYSSPDSLVHIIQVLEKNNVKLDTRYADMYRDLRSQQQLMDNGIVEHELDDSNSFLTIAINSAFTKDLDHSEVDENFSSYILQPEPLGDACQYEPYRHQSGADIEPYRHHPGLDHGNGQDLISPLEHYPSPTNLVTTNNTSDTEEDKLNNECCRSQPMEIINTDHYQEAPDNLEKHSNIDLSTNTYRTEIKDSGIDDIANNSYRPGIDKASEMDDMSNNSYRNGIAKNSCMEDELSCNTYRTGIGKNASIDNISSNTYRSGIVRNSDIEISSDTYRAEVKHGMDDIMSNNAYRTGIGKGSALEAKNNLDDSMSNNSYRQGSDKSSNIDGIDTLSSNTYRSELKNSGIDEMYRSQSVFQQSSNKNALSQDSSRNSPISQERSIHSPMTNTSMSYRNSPNQHDMGTDQYRPLNIGLEQPPLHFYRQQDNRSEADQVVDIYRTDQQQHKGFKGEEAIVEEPTIYRTGQDNRDMGETIYREDICRNVSVTDSMYRPDDPQGDEFPSEIYSIDHYRNSESCSQYGNYRIGAESTMLRSQQNLESGEYNLTIDESKQIQASEAEPLPIVPSLSRQDRLERLQNKTDFDFSTEYQIIEQVINEHRMCEERSKYSGVDRIKRYDPKHRVLTEAYRQMEASLNEQTTLEACTLKTETNTTATDSQAESLKNKPKPEKTVSDCQFSKPQSNFDCISKAPANSQITITPVNVQEFFNEAEDNPENVNDSNVQKVTGSHKTFSPPSPLNSQLTTCPEPLQTPEKIDLLQNNTLANTPTPKASNKTDGQPLFLTPKEKYAKEFFADKINENSVRVVGLTFDLPETVPPKNDSVVSLEEPSMERNEKVYEGIDLKPKQKMPLVSTILKAKKKLASQKKLILEHGEVRLTQKQRLKIKPVRKRITKIIVANMNEGLANPKSRGHIDKIDVKGPQPVELKKLPEKNLNPPSVEIETPQKRKIINRKDKLLAEHRSQNNVVPKQLILHPKYDNKAVETKSTHSKKNVEIVKNLVTTHHQAQKEEPEALITKESLQNSAISDQLQCEKCNYKSKTTARLKLHMILHDKDQEHLCPFCDHKCSLRKEHIQHIKDNHARGPPYKCPNCSYTNIKLQQMLAHSACHTDREPLACKAQGCGYTTQSVHNLKKHEKVHKTDSKFICDICSKSFAHKNTLEQHQAVHSNEKKFKCKNCTFSTKYNSHLAAHKRIHEGNVHRCSMEGCQYWTPKLTLLKAHLRAHNGDKCFKCTTCNKGFVEAGQLKRHEKTHSNDKPFKCDIDKCKYSTNRKDKLKEHQLRAHKNSPSEDTSPQNLPLSQRIKKKPPKFVLSLIPKRAPSPDQQAVYSPSEVPYVKEEVFGSEPVLSM